MRTWTRTWRIWASIQSLWMTYSGVLVKNVYRKEGEEKVNPADMQELTGTEHEIKRLDVGHLSLVQAPVSTTVLKKIKKTYICLGCGRRTTEFSPQDRSMDLCPRCGANIINTDNYFDTRSEKELQAEADA